MRHGRLLAVALVASAALAALAADIPHDEAIFNFAGAFACENCHRGHSAEAAGLTKVLGNQNSCNSCHLSQVSFGFPWADTDQATPGVGGRSHRWDALATNFGATPPDPGSADASVREMAARLDGGRLTCSTCHDQHDNDLYKGTVRVGPRVRVATDAADTAQDVIRNAGTSGRVQITKAANTAVSRYYRIRTPTTTTFQVSWDDGATWRTAKSFTLNTPVGIDEATDPTPNSVEVTFRQAPSAGAEWDTFYVSFPFLRASNTDGAMCLICHKDRDMRWQDVEGGVANGIAGGVLTSVTLGTTVFHHPVKQALNANGQGYDRAAPIDADGSAADTNLTNDLELGAGNVVTCMTCHQPHNADSNSLTVDP